MTEGIDLFGIKSGESITKDAYIYIDKTQKLSLDEVKLKRFEKASKGTLAYGYSPEFTVWVRLDLKNFGDRAVSRILEYKHVLTTEVNLYDGKSVYKKGLFNFSYNDETLTPIFPIELEKNQERTIYLKTSSKTLPLIVDLHLYTGASYYKKEMKHQRLLFLFFGGMIVLFIYNIFIFLFTKNSSYLYYLIYLFGVVLHHGLFTGVVYSYVPQWFITYVGVVGIYGVIYIFIFGLVQFIRRFLELDKYPLIVKIFNYYLYLLAIVVVLGIAGILDGYEAIFFTAVGLYVFGVSVYVAYKERSLRAYYVLIGWFSVLVSFVLLVIKNCGVCELFNDFSYILELGIGFEALILSVALADIINRLQDEKRISDRRLLIHIREEKARLKKEVDRKTTGLKKALFEKEILFKELHHRVKNNLQIVLSLLRLKKDKMEDELSKEVLVSLELKISAMSHLHELLYKQEDAESIDTKKYIDLIVQGVSQAFGKRVDIQCNIVSTLRLEDGIYCGIILNELVTNAFKYGLEDGGKLEISLVKEGELHKATIADNGRGYDTSKSYGTLGLKLVENLVKKQLKGEIVTGSSSLGTKVDISWRCDDER